AARPFFRRFRISDRTLFVFFMSDSAPSDDNRTAPAGTEAVPADPPPAPAAKKSGRKKSGGTEATEARDESGRPRATRSPRAPRAGKSTKSEQSSLAGSADASSPPEASAPELPHFADSFSPSGSAEAEPPSSREE